MDHVQDVCCLSVLRLRLMLFLTLKNFTLTVLGLLEGFLLQWTQLINLIDYTQVLESLQ